MYSAYISAVYEYVGFSVSSNFQKIPSNAFFKKYLIWDYVGLPYNKPWKIEGKKNSYFWTARGYFDWILVRDIDVFDITYF